MLNLCPDYCRVFCRNICIELYVCLLQGRGGVAARLPDLGGVQRATTSNVLPPFTRKGTTPRQFLWLITAPLWSIVRVNLRRDREWDARNWTLSCFRVSVTAKRNLCLWHGEVLFTEFCSLPLCILFVPTGPQGPGPSLLWACGG